jgi:phosphate transport system protein
MSSIRATLDKSIKELEQDVIELGSMVRLALFEALRALKERNSVLAEQIIKNDDQLDDLSRRIDQKAVETIATQQPAARDLRVIIAIIRIVTDLERIGDLCNNVAKQVTRIADRPLLKPLIDIPRMVEIAAAMLEDGLQAFLARDPVRAEKMCLRDDEVDGLRYQVQRELLTYMMEDPRTIERATALLMISLYLERAADHVTNIGEQVVYLVTGRWKDLNL